jgi:hypothetical protein
MNTFIRKIAPALLLACSTCLPSFSADMNMQGALYQSHAKADWISDPAHSGQRMIHLVSESPVALQGGTAALTITPDDSVLGGKTLERVTFDVDFVKQVHKNVKPETVIDWLEINPTNGQRKEKQTKLKLDQVKKGIGSNGRVACELDLKAIFNLPQGMFYEVRRITVGGREIPQAGFNCFMDINIGNLKLYKNSRQIPADVKTDLNVLRVTNQSGHLRDLMKDLKGEPM